MKKAFWHADFRRLKIRKPCWQRKFTCLLLLPKWWPWKYGGWTFWNLIIVSPGLLAEAPRNTRRYLLGHEYGHIYHGHNLYTIIVYLALAGFCIGSAYNSKLTAGISLLILSAVYVLRIIKEEKAELLADRMAIALAGKDAAIEGFLWMAEKTGTTEKLWRQKRLSHMKNPGTILLGAFLFNKMESKKGKKCTFLK